MPKKELQREQALRRIARHVLKNGLAKTTLRQLAEAANCSDRMLLYYFKNKDEVIVAVLTKLAEDLAEALEHALPADRLYLPHELFAEAAQIVNSPPLDKYMHVGLEITAAAARGQRPYVEISKNVATEFVSWIDQRLYVENADERKAIASALLAMIDGLNVLNISAGEKMRMNAERIINDGLARLQT